MNREIRKYLIDQCVAGRPIYYEDVTQKLNLNLRLEKDRQELSKTLGEISTYEYSKGRPLISSIAIYKTSNDHGNGFYSLCENLGIGKASKLKRDFYGFTELERSKTFWQNSFNHRQFYEIQTPIYNESENPFIRLDEIKFFRKWANKVYDKANPDHFSAKNYLLETVWEKTKFWSDEVVKRLADYETSNKRMWSKRDWKDGNRVSTFKPYTWARIFKNGDRDKDIFFTIGIDAPSKALIYKLDYYHEDDSNLSQEQKELCKKHIPHSLSWNEIPESELSQWDWESLIIFTVEFIAKNSQHYDQLVKLVWGKVTPKEIFKNNITLRDFPNNGYPELPVLNPSFKGSKTNYEQKHREDKELGDIGEELVLTYEINKLKHKGLFSLANLVRIVDDGMGYDILSFNEKGMEIYIEVKTTTGNEKTPFFLSQNEKLFYEQNVNKYFIYRLYNYDSDSKTADFFIVINVEKELLFQPTEFKVFIKKT